MLLRYGYFCGVDLCALQLREGETGKGTMDEDSYDHLTSRHL